MLCQFQADVLGVPVRRPLKVRETTALGAAHLAGLAGVRASPTEAAAKLGRGIGFEPHARRGRRAQAHEWHRAVERARGWANDAAERYAIAADGWRLRGWRARLDGHVFGLLGRVDVLVAES